MKIFSYQGIPLIIHWSLVAMLLTMFPFMPAQTILSILTFIFIIPHEYGHALVAKKLGYQVESIIMTPLGGMAILTSQLKTAYHELVIVLAGPIINLLLLFLFVLFDGIYPCQFFITCAIVNLALFVFNILPMFPTDGGRVLRAILSMSVGHYYATLWTIQLSYVMCSILTFIGCLMCNFGLIFIAIFIAFVARQEHLQLKNTIDPSM